MKEQTMDILAFISLLRGNDYVEENIRGVALLNTHIFTRGDCGRFALIILAVYRDATAHLSVKKATLEKHVVVKYQGDYYDITGKLDEDDYLIQQEKLSFLQLYSMYSKFEMISACNFLSLLEKTKKEENRMQSFADKYLTGDFLNTAWKASIDASVREDVMAWKSSMQKTDTSIRKGDKFGDISTLFETKASEESTKTESLGVCFDDV